MIDDYNSLTPNFLTNIKKNLFLSLIALITLFLGATQTAKADSDVYFFVDFRYLAPEFVISLNGEPAFTLNPEVDKHYEATGMTLYKMVARKVTFKNEGTYVLEMVCHTGKGDMKAELNLNIEDGQTYYVNINSVPKKPLYAEVLSEKEGLKKMKKSEGKQYTINEPIVYEGK